MLETDPNLQSVYSVNMCQALLALVVPDLICGFLYLSTLAI